MFNTKMELTHTKNKTPKQNDIIPKYFIFQVFFVQSGTTFYVLTNVVVIKQ